MTRVTRSFEQKRGIARRLIEDLNNGLTIQHAVRREGIPYTSMIEILRYYVIINFQERYPGAEQIELDFSTPPSKRSNIRIRPPARYLHTPTKK